MQRAGDQGHAPADGAHAPADPAGVPGVRRLGGNYQPQGQVQDLQRQEARLGTQVLRGAHRQGHEGRPDDYVCGRERPSTRRNTGRRRHRARGEAT